MLAPAKLTLSLRVVGVRPDGFHLLDAEMVTLSLADVVEVEPGLGLEVTGPKAGGVPVDESNLACRALAACGRTGRVRVEKHVPAGAGLGGGSADAAAVLRWAGCTDLAVAASVGADVPFCLVGGRARVRGTGEAVEPLPFEDRVFTLLIPPAAVATAAVYKAWDDLGGPTGEGGNDLEPAALAVAPELARWRDRLGNATGVEPRLAGSGSSWFVEGEFPGPDHLVVRTVRAREGPARTEQQAAPPRAAPSS
ncbi:MAG TPA: 4-(cytidine 5'-diphospho)-2-C-methyl-D-erythritol kinase [Acidimicrobiales bacterium]|nr:4-(cytidine 5'-diphospho)-2-C-methyl-D-erythritol kinase [Acidimicrobiales bacterium]